MDAAILKNGADPHEPLASPRASTNGAEFQFERQEWVLFRSVNTLSQKAGVPKERLRRLVLKELADNALDAGGRVAVGGLTDDGRPYPGSLYGCNRFFVQDDGPGIPGSPEEIGRLFSINRPLISSKLWRLPTRGAMGNGLRVIVGAVAASDGALEVWTRNRRHVLKPQNDGSTAVETSEVVFPTGTRIEITFGSALPGDFDPLAWVEDAICVAAAGPGYQGKPSPWWYDADHFFELLQAAGTRPVRDLIANLDGCSGAKAGKIAASFKNTVCSVLTREQATSLLLAARAEARRVRPERLGPVGRLDTMPPFYACQHGEVELGGRAPKAKVPFVAEAWAYPLSASENRADVCVLVNRTPVTGQMRVYREKKEIQIFGCGLRHSIEAPKGSYDIWVNLTTPYCPITTDGKEPNLDPFSGEICKAIARAIRQAHRSVPKETTVSETTTQKAIFLAHLREGIAKASGDGVYRFNQRQLFYVLRPFVIEALGIEPTYKNFEQIVTDYEAEHGDIPGMYRDPRGTLYHPHMVGDIPLGTLAVEDYKRPNWIFNKILYIEKEGFFESLKAAGWPERHDCALLTSKGFSTRAVRDFLDLLPDSGEPVTVFCLHDADAAGTMIYQTLQEETKARGRRRVEIVNLGLEPWEAVDMGLAIEKVKRDRERRAPVADYVLERPDGAYWGGWLQSNRIELNAMTTPHLLEWLDAKMQEHGGEKVIPPAPVVADTMSERLNGHLHQIITERILREARIEEQVARAGAKVAIPDGEDLVHRLGPWLDENRDRLWSEYIDGIAQDLAHQAEHG